MARERFVVTAGRYDTVSTRHDPVTGETWQAVEFYHGIAFSTAYGIEYIHLHGFPDTAAGSRAAGRLARRVQAVLNDRGVDGLNLSCWGDRVIYGSQAYQDDEPYIVEREKSDALLSEAFGG